MELRGEADRVQTVVLPVSSTSVTPCRKSRGMKQFSNHPAPPTSELFLEWISVVAADDIGRHSAGGKGGIIPARAITNYRYSRPECDATLYERSIFTPPLGPVDVFLPRSPKIAGARITCGKSLKYKSCREMACHTGSRCGREPDAIRQKQQRGLQPGANALPRGRSLRTNRFRLDSSG